MPRQQTGAALVVSLLLLLVMTILAVSMSQTTTLQERMAGNARDSDAAFQAAEAALRAGESFVDNTDDIIPCSTSISCGKVLGENYFQKNSTDLSQTDKSWWDSNGTTIGASSVQEMTKIVEDPHYVIEKRGRYKISGLGTGRGGKDAYRTYYQVTASGSGTTDRSQATTQSVFSKPE